MARFNESYNSLSLLSSMLVKPSKIITSAGSSKFCTNVSGFSMPIARESTGLMQCFLIAANWSSEIFPSITYVIALLIIGSSFSLRSFTHCSAESALWSNCPGRNSTVNTLASPYSKLSS